MYDRGKCAMAVVLLIFGVHVYKCEGHQGDSYPSSELKKNQNSRNWIKRSEKHRRHMEGRKMIKVKSEANG